MELAIQKFTSVGTALKFKFSLTSFLAIYELPFVHYFVVIPRLDSLAVLQVVAPLADKH